MLSKQSAILLIYFAWGTLYTPSEEFENGGFTPKTLQMFSVHITPEEFKNETITSNFGFVFEAGNLGQGNHTIIVAPSFSKSYVFKMFSVDTKTVRKAGVFKFLQFEERVFSKSLVVFPDRLMWTVGLTLEIKLRERECDILNIIVVKTEKSRYPEELTNQHGVDWLTLNFTL